MSGERWAPCGAEALQFSPAGQRWRGSGGWGMLGGRGLGCLSRTRPRALGQGGDPLGRGPWRVPGVRAPSSAPCSSVKIKHRPPSHACLCRRKRRLAAGGERGAAGPHVPVQECGGAGPGRGGERRRSAMGRPVLLAAAAAAALLLLLPSGTGAAVTRLRVSANFVSAGAGRWRGKVGPGGAALTAVSLLAGVPGHR